MKFMAKASRHPWVSKNEPGGFHVFTKTPSPGNSLIPIIGVHLDDLSTQILEATINSVSSFELVGSLHQYFGEKDAALIRAVRELHPQICIIDLDQDRQMALETVEYLRRTTSAPLAIFALSSRMDSDSIIAAMRSGCTEYLAKPIQTDRLTEAFGQITRKQRETESGPLQGKIVTLMGVKGGVGTTTLAVHLANAFAISGKRTLLIDHHQELGEATLHLALEHHNYGFHELVCNLTRFDAELLQGFVLKHKSGLEVLASPEALGSAPGISSDGILHTLRSLVRMYDFIIIDTDSGFHERNLAILEMTDELMLITEAHLPAVRNTSRFLDYLQRLNYSAAKIQIILNRWAKSSPITVDHIEKILRRKVTVNVPDAESEVEEAISTGVPVPFRSRSDFSQSITNWVRRISGDGDSDSKSKAKTNERESRSRFNLLGISS